MYPFTGTLLGIFLLGLLTRRISGPPTLGAALVGLAVTITIPLAGIPVSNFYFGVIAAGTTFVTAILAGALFPAMDPKADGRPHMVVYAAWLQRPIAGQF